MFDQYLENKIARLKKEIFQWAQKNDLWFDTGFNSYFDYVTAEPNKIDPVILVIWSEGPLAEVLNGHWGDEFQMQFISILDKHGFWYELYTHTTAYIFCQDNNSDKDIFYQYFKWQWVCHLIKPDFDELNTDIYNYITHHPERLSTMHWRKFEELLASLFQSQGFHTELGPGSNDGGKDITVFQRDPLGDVMTYVQAKRYDPKYKIKLEAVQALHGLVVSDEVQKGIFVTTSEYLPSATKFAARENVQMELYAGPDVIDWCSQASEGIVTDKSILVSTDEVKRRLMKAKHDPRGLIVHATTGYTTRMNLFALIVKETKHAALLMILPRKVVKHDGHMLFGTEVPDISVQALEHHNADMVSRFQKSGEHPDVHFWDGKNLFAHWDNQPKEFDHLD